jgi:hypothetical protein
MTKTICLNIIGNQIISTIQHPAIGNIAESFETCTFDTSNLYDSGEVVDRYLTEEKAIEGHNNYIKSLLTSK